MKTHILKQQVKDILDTMNDFGDVDSFELDIESSSGIGTKISLSSHMIYRGLAGKFTVEVVGNENW